MQGKKYASLCETETVLITFIIVPSLALNENFPRLSFSMRHPLKTLLNINREQMSASSLTKLTTKKAKEGGRRKCLIKNMKSNQMPKHLRRLIRLFCKIKLF